MNNLHIGCWSELVDKKEMVPTFIFDNGNATNEISDCYVVTPKADRARIEALLSGGACQVLIGEAALLDSNLLIDAVQQFGGDRIGVWLPVRRATTHWNLDRESNADFSFVSISSPLPRWMVLRNDGSLTDVDALWWAGEMLKAGCSSVMVSVDDPQDDDLLACAEMSEIAADHFWLDTRTDDVEELRFWVKYGHAQQLVVPSESDVNTLYACLNNRLMQEPAMG